MKWQVDFFHHCQGMEFPDKRNFGEWTAVSGADAIEQVLDASFHNCTKADREYIKGCLSARMVGSFPSAHAPRTDDVILVKKADIPKMARMLSDRACGSMEVDQDYLQEYWEEYGEQYVADVKAILGVQDEKF